MTTSAVLANVDLLGTILKQAVSNIEIIDTLKHDSNRPALRMLSPLACSLIDDAVTSYVDLRYSALEKSADFDGINVARQAEAAIKRLSGLRTVRLEV